MSKNIQALSSGGSVNVMQPSAAMLENMRSTVPQLLDASAAQYGDKTLIDFFNDDRTLSYQELAIESRKLADSLVRLGVRKRTHVALMMPNCREWVVAWMALARIGAVMTAVNPYYKPAELSFVLNDSDAQLLIAHEQCIPTFDAMDAEPELIAIGGVVTTGDSVTGDRHDFDRLVAVGSSSFEPPVPPESADLLAIQYTSGTTGFPKGCMQTHQYWRQVSTLAAEAYGQGIERILVTFPLYYFDPQAQIMMALQSGMTVYLANRHSLSEFMGWVKKYKIQTCSMTPQASNNMPVSDDDSETDLRHIIGYYYRGEEHFEAEKRFGVPVRELFGMTEIGIGTLVPLDATDMVGRDSCGIIAPCREFTIRDDEGQPVPVGEPGEIWFRGPGLFLGYYKRTKANRESFVGDWFRSGDLARQDERGYVWIIGRLKEMIKRSGENIASIEVESTLRLHPDVIEAGVLGVPDPKRKEEVKAYIVLAPGKTQDNVTPEMLTAHCRELLADFKVPRYWAYVSDFPRTATNKIAKQRMIDAAKDLRADAYDRVEGIWR